MKKTICFFLVLILFSCEEQIQFKSEITEISSNNYKECFSQDCPSIEISYPIFKEPISSADNINKEIESFVLSSLDHTLVENKRSINSLVETIITNTQNAYPEQVNDLSQQEIELHAFISYSNNDVLSLKFDSFQFTGGAHGISATEYLNLDPKTGGQIEFKNFIDDIEELTAFAKAKFIDKYGPLEDFWFEKNQFNLPEQMGFNEDGLHLYYAVYEIAPYAEGDFELTLSWEEVEEYLIF